MKRFVGLTLAFSGAILGLFLVNLILYAYNPKYHEALEAAVAGDSHIPVVTADGKKTYNVQKTSEVDESRTNSIQVASGVDGNKNDNGQAEKSLIEISEQDDNAGVPLAASYEKEVKPEDEPAKPSIVDKEYHEDCGTGEGYWIIHYSDGSVEVE